MQRDAEVAPGPNSRHPSAVTAPSLLWLRQDLRLNDHPALIAASRSGPVIPVYVHDDAAPGRHRMGPIQRQWLRASLEKLGVSFSSKGASLILRRGNIIAELTRLAAETGASRVYAIRHYEPWWQEAESELGAEVELVLHDGNQLAPPSSLLTGSGTRYRVFTPWWRALLERMPPPEPLAAPDIVTSVDGVSSDRLADWNFGPAMTGAGAWTPGEAGADAMLEALLQKIGAYDVARDFPDREAPSHLSPHLHFGEISPAAIWHRACLAAGSGAEPFLRQLGWRDYAANLIGQLPTYGLANGRPAYDRMPWRTGDTAERDFAAWVEGRTGYPIVDAGMRELHETGYMHNRVRMLAASFLIKHLLLDWRRGERWFWDHLFDADYASNSANWQWVAGTGVDAPLFSRIMAPLSQSVKFAAGEYIRKWIPELAGLPEPAIHDPDEHGLRPASYPPKIIGHHEARERALAAMRSVRDAH